MVNRDSASVLKEHKTKKYGVLSSFILLFFVLSCGGDDFLNKRDATDSIIVNEFNNWVKVTKITGDKVASIIEKLKKENNIFNNFDTEDKHGRLYKTDNNGTINYNEILEVIDTLGNSNYTFGIDNHPLQDEKTFYNLVVNGFNNNDGLKVFLVKYEMSDEFANQYNNGQKKLYEFTGNITSYPLGSKNTLCEQIKTPIKGGENYSGGGASGNVGDTGYGDAGGNYADGSSGGGVGASCTSISFVCDDCGNSYSNREDYSSSVCGKGSYGLTIIFTYESFSSCRPLTTGCSPGGSFGIINPTNPEPIDHIAELEKITDKDAQTPFRAKIDEYVGLLDVTEVEAVIPTWDDTFYDRLCSFKEYKEKQNGQWITIYNTFGTSIQTNFNFNYNTIQGSRISKNNPNRVSLKYTEPSQDCGQFYGFLNLKYQVGSNPPKFMWERDFELISRYKECDYMDESDFKIPANLVLMKIISP